MKLILIFLLIVSNSLSALSIEDKVIKTLTDSCKGLKEFKKQNFAYFGYGKTLHQVASDMTIFVSVETADTIFENAQKKIGEDINAEMYLLQTKLYYNELLLKFWYNFFKQKISHDGQYEKIVLKKYDFSLFKEEGKNTWNYKADKNFYKRLEHLIEVSKYDPGSAFNIKKSLEYFTTSQIKQYGQDYVIAQFLQIAQSKESSKNSIYFSLSYLVDFVNDRLQKMQEIKESIKIGVLALKK